MTKANDDALNPQRIENTLSALLPQSQHPLHQAMRYSVLNGGKRLRPLLVYTTGVALGCSLAQLDPAAAAIEMVHCYSLIHDDLPAMDNDDFRRNQPTCHKQFNEATAILAGDALPCLAIDTIIKGGYSAMQQVQLIELLNQANSTMILGQSLDCQFDAASLKLETINQIHQTKTGALFEAAILMAATISQCDSHTYTQLRSFAQKLGLAYQIQDDLLDYAQEDNQTPSYPNAIGVEASEKTLNELRQQCQALLEKLALHHSGLVELLNRCTARSE